MFALDIKSEEGLEKIKINAHPDTCPVCLHGIDPRFISGYVVGSKSELIYQCPRKDCRHLFIGYYSAPIINGKRGSIFSLKKLIPQTHNDRNFSEQITSVSTDFVRIFNQANHAEELGMSYIAGPGYRKALEFLIKAYSILNTPEALEVIKHKQLSNVINDYVTDANMKSTAKRAAWLGNDETHYYRKWEDRDIDDLKILIELTVRWIESELLTRQYEKSMSD